MKILHVMKILPAPPQDGIRSDIWDRMRAMNRLGCRIHALIMQPKGPVDRQGLAQLRTLAERVDFVERWPASRSIASLTPTLVSRNNTLARFPLSDEYDLTLAETEHVMPIFDNPRLRTQARVLRVHNNEAKYMWELAETEERFRWKLFFAVEALRNRAFLQSAHRKVDSLWFISQRECDKFKRIAGESQPTVFWLPPAIAPESTPERSPSATKHVLFVGGLKNPLNREGMRWYLREVHPLLAAADSAYELTVAGNAEGSPEARRFAEELTRQERCTVHLGVADLGPIYDNCALLINPMQRGSGVKMKTVHAVQHRVPLVTTSVGAEGSGFSDREHVRLADNPAAFASAISDILNDPRSGKAMADRAYRYLTAHYDSRKNLETLFSSVIASLTAADQVAI